MKRLTAGLLALMLLATLLPGCGKKEQWNVDNFFLSDDGTTYSVSYRHDDGTEEVVAEMGSYPQPLTIIAGKLYYVHGGSMVAVDLKDPTQRQALTEPGLSGLSIGFIDDGAVYCPLATDTEKCYRVALDLSECTRVVLDRCRLELVRKLAELLVGHVDRDLVLNAIIFHFQVSSLSSHA